MIDWFRRLSPTDQDELRGQYQQPRQPIGPVGLEELVRDYSRDLSLQGKAQNTVRVYAQDVGKFQRFLLLSERDVTEMGFELVCEYTRYLVGQGYKPKTVQLALDALRSFTRFLRREGVLGLHQVPRPQDLKTKVPEDLPRFLTLEQVERLLTTPDDRTVLGIRDRAILDVFYSSGIRLNELTHLDLEDIDLERMALFIRFGKGSKQRVVFFGKPCQWALTRYLNESRPYILDGIKEAPALWLNRYGRRISNRGVEKMFREYADQGGLPEWAHPHTLRHSFATHMMEAHAGIRQIQELLGHSSIMTTQVYTHVTQQEARRSLLNHHPRANAVKGENDGQD